MSYEILERWPQGDGIEYSTIAVLYGFIITSRSTHMVYILYYHSTFCHKVTVEKECDSVTKDELQPVVEMGIEKIANRQN